ncbi:MAG: 50S ribosomal protein L13 [Eubacteriales bacterium]|nr:50S ribosomal protein L13 [Eubacteriales bacterium]
MKTFMPKAAEISRKWYVVDAEGQTLGRLASEVAKVLRGKNKPTFTPHADMGDFVIVVNADKVVLTGNKLDQKYHYHHTGYPGGLKSVKYRDLLKNNPEEVVMHAVKGMLPKNSLGRQTLKKLRVYRGAEHPHAAQKPETMELNIQLG